MRKRFCQPYRNRLRTALLLSNAVAWGVFNLRTTHAAGNPEPGLAVTFTALDGDKARANDVIVLPNLRLFVPAGRAPTPFLPAGKFSSEWTGFVSSEIRDNYTFQAELTGTLKLEINGAVVWEASAEGTNAGPSKPVRLNKGTNAFTLHYTSPAEGDAFVRLFWSSRDFASEPLALSVLTLDTVPELPKGNQLRSGRELFVEFRCAKCHTGPAPDAGIPELAMDAPTFEGIGARRNYDWMTRWIADPKTLRPTPRMPKLLHGLKEKEDAEAIAAFLASLKSDPPPADAKERDAGQTEAGRKLYETLHCVACHNTPATPENDPQKISFTHVREKFVPGALTAFLRKPEAYYAWIRMPNFKLTADEAAPLATFLESGVDKPKDVSGPGDVALIERGKKLAQTSGCLNCHTLKLENQFKTKSLVELTPDKWKQGCLAGNSSDGSKAPRFNFTVAERDALQAFAATDRASLTRHVPSEFAERQARLLRCAECHGRFEGFPPWDTLGGKMKPEWMKAFIGGELAYKPRPWLETRMPAFPQYAEALALGLAERHGFPPRTPLEPPIDEETAKVGRKLVSANGGFLCVSCHAVGSKAAMQVFESNGVNLAYTGARLQKEYYHRWVRNPLRIEPATKMPVYFDSEGKSPLTDYYNGDAEKQIEAIWQYIRLGDKMLPPVEAQ